MSWIRYTKTVLVGALSWTTLGKLTTLLTPPNWQERGPLPIFFPFDAFGVSRGGGPT